MGQALSLEEASEEVVQAPRVITRAKLSPCQPLPLPIPPARRAPSTDAIALPGKQQTQPQQPQQQAPQVLQSEMRDNLKAILNATSSIQEQRIRAVVKQIEERNITPLPVFSLALSAASARHGLRVVLRRITNTKQYWAGSKGSAFLLCIPAGVNTISSETLIVDPGFRTLFETPRMTPRYREVLSLLPETFVGQAAQLITLLQLVCGEMALMFEQLEWTMPPWRTYSAFASRWLSGSCLDTMVPVAGQGLKGPAAAEVQAFIASCNSAAGSAGSSPTKAASPGARGATTGTCPPGGLPAAGAPAGAAPGGLGAACEGEGLMQRAERAVSQRLAGPHVSSRPHLIRVGFEVSRID